MKDALASAAVTARVVQDTLLYAVRAEDAGGKLVAIRRQRERPRHASTVQYQRAQRQFGDRNVLQIIVEERLDPLVGSAKVVRQQSFLFSVFGDKRGDYLVQCAAAVFRDWCKAQQGELDVDIAFQV